jgi:hypothetical protein
MRLRLRITGEGLRLTGSPGGRKPAPPTVQLQAVLATENNEALADERGELLAVEPPHGQ